jgi:hypothetical protein
MWIQRLEDSAAVYSGTTQLTGHHGHSATLLEILLTGISGNKLENTMLQSRNQEDR